MIQPDRHQLRKQIQRIERSLGYDIFRHAGCASFREYAKFVRDLPSDGTIPVPTGIDEDLVMNIIKTAVRDRWP